MDTTIMESVVREQNIRKDEVMNKYNYHRKHDTRAKHQKNE